MILGITARWSAVLFLLSVVTIFGFLLSEPIPVSMVGSSEEVAVILGLDCGSLLILSFKVTPPFKADSKHVEELLKFIRSLGRLCADKVYLSWKVCSLNSRARREAVHLRQEERHEDQGAGLEGLEADARDVPTEQEAVQEAVPQF